MIIAITLKENNVKKEEGQRASVRVPMSLVTAACENSERDRETGIACHEV